MFNPLNSRRDIMKVFAAGLIGFLGGGKAAAENEELQTAAKRQVSERTGISESNLTIINDTKTVFKYIGETYYRAKIQSLKSGDIFSEFLDLNGDSKDKSKVFARENTAYEKENGKRVNY